MRSLRLALAALALTFAAAPAVRADDESIFKDWKDIKTRGVAHAKERGEFWEAKGVAAKDQIWLGKIWDRAGELDKAVTSLEGFLKGEKPNEVNKEAALQTLMQIAVKKHDWPGAIAAGERFRKEFPSSKVTGEVLDEEGRAQRMAGDREKALAGFTASADAKFAFGAVDLVDLFLSEGKIDEAKATIAKYLEIEEIKKKGVLDVLQKFVDIIGTAAPSIEKGCSIGITPAPTSWGEKPAVLYRWNIPMPEVDKRLERVRNFAIHFAEKANVFGLSGYDHYNPNNKKVEDEMTEEYERDIQSQVIKQMPGGGPPGLLVPKDVFEGLKQVNVVQWTIIDTEGKFRYLRISSLGEEGPYDVKCVGLALLKLIGG